MTVSNLNETADLGVELELATEQLNAAQLEGPGQEQLRDEILSFMASHPDALHRHCLAGHITASAVVIDRQRQATLLIFHKKLQMWLQPGGHVDGSGDLASAAWREASEETGIVGLEVLTPAIDVDIHPIGERGSEPAHLHLDVRFVVIAPPGATENPCEEETLGARWFSPDELNEVVHTEELQRLLLRGFARANIGTSQHRD